MINNSIKLQLLEQKEWALGIKAELLDIYQEALAEGDIHTMHQVSISYDECDRIVNRIDCMLEIHDVISIYQ